MNNRWEYKKLDDLVLIDQQLLKESTPKNFSFYYIDISSAFEGKLRLPSTQIAFRNSPSRARKVIKRKDVLMSSVRPNLKAFAFFDHSEDDCVASTGFAILSAKDKVDPKFILYSILSDDLTSQIESHVVGSNYPAINTRDIRRLQILTPPYNEQRKIAKILTTVDNLIEKTETLIAKYQSIKQGMMHDLFTRGVDANGQLRPPVDEAPELYKESELGWIPKGWEVLRIEDLATQVTDGDHHTPIRSNSGEFLLSARNILNGEIILKDVDYVPFSEYQRMIKRCFPQPGDILISCSGTIGRICEVPYNLKFGLVRSVALIKLNKDKYLSRYAEWTLRSEIIQRQILNSQLQAAQPNLFQEPIKKLLVPLPKKQEQEFIYNKLDLLERCIKTETINTKKMINLKHGLMQDLLTGKVRVTPDKPKDTKS